MNRLLRTSPTALIRQKIFLDHVTLLRLTTSSGHVLHGEARVVLRVLSYPRPVSLKAYRSTVSTLR